MFYTQVKKQRWAKVPETDNIHFVNIKICGPFVYLTIVFDKSANGGIALLTYDKQVICKYLCEDGNWYTEESSTEKKYNGWIQTAHTGIFELCC